jgi:hypothetical protein
MVQVKARSWMGWGTALALTFALAGCLSDQNADEHGTAPSTPSPEAAADGASGEGGAEGGSPMSEAGHDTGSTADSGEGPPDSGHAPDSGEMNETSAGD